MTKTNYKLIAKKHLANLEKEYEELKIKNTFTYDYFTEKEKADKYYEVINENRK